MSSIEDKNFCGAITNSRYFCINPSHTSFPDQRGKCGYAHVCAGEKIAFPIFTLDYFSDDQLIYYVASGKFGNKTFEKMCELFNTAHNDEKLSFDNFEQKAKSFRKDSIKFLNLINLIKKCGSTCMRALGFHECDFTAVNGKTIFEYRKISCGSNNNGAKCGGHYATKLWCSVKDCKNALTTCNKVHYNFFQVYKQCYPNVPLEKSIPYEVAIEKCCVLLGLKPSDYICTDDPGKSHFRITDVPIQAEQPLPVQAEQPLPVQVPAQVPIIQHNFNPASLPFVGNINERQEEQDVDPLFTKKLDGLAAVFMNEVQKILYVPSSDDFDFKQSYEKLLAHLSPSTFVFDVAAHLRGLFKDIYTNMYNGNIEKSKESRQQFDKYFNNATVLAASNYNYECVIYLVFYYTTTIVVEYNTKLFGRSIV